MRVDSVDFFYAAMPEITLDADGSQDALLVRVTADSGATGWGECEASPLTSIAAFVTPRSHGVCRPVSDSVIGQQVDTPDDIRRVAALVERNSMDLLQSAHTFSGIEIALWDMLGRSRQEPVWRLLGYDQTTPKVPYASMLLGQDPQSTLDHVGAAVRSGFHAVKIGWGSFGQGSVSSDADHVAAAREALGSDGILLVDAGQIWVDDVEAAAARVEALASARATWLEEPFLPHAYSASAELATRMRGVGLAGGESAHTPYMATNLIDYGGVRYIQVDSGRIGGIGAAKTVADHAVGANVTFVNHTFTSHLALSASLQAYAGLADHRICEYPVAPSDLARAITHDQLIPSSGTVRAPDAPGLGVEVAIEAVEPYLRTVDIWVDGTPLYADRQSVRRPASA